MVTTLFIALLIGLCALFWFDGKEDEDLKPPPDLSLQMDEKDELPIIPIVLSTLDEPLIIGPE